MNDEKNKNENIKREEAMDYDEISIREIIEALLKHKMLIAVFFVVFALGSLVFTFITAGDFATTVINHPEDEDFSKTDIISSEVLGRVIKELDLTSKGINAHNLQESLKVENIKEKEDEKSNVLLPTDQYRITAKDSSDLSMAPHLKRNILSSVIDNYRKQYNEKMLGEMFYPTLSEEFIKIGDMNYPVINVTLKTYLDDLENTNKKILQKAKLFRSSKHDITFADLESKIKLVKKIDYEIFSTLVDSYSGEDKDITISYYKDMIKELQLEKDKKILESQYLRELLNKADPMKNGDIPSLIVENDKNKAIVADIFNKLYKDNYYPELVDASIESSFAVIEKESEIRYLQNEIQKLQNKDNNTFNENKLQKIENEMQTIILKLNNLSNIYNNMVQEYYEDSTKKTITYVITPYSKNDIGNLQLNFAIGCVLGLMLGVFLAFFKEYWKNSKEEQ